MNRAARTATIASTASTSRRKRPRGMARRALAHAVLLLGASTMVVPMLWMISTSLKQEGAIFTYPPQWIPDPWVLSNA